MSFACDAWFAWFAAVSVQSLPLLLVVVVVDRLASPTFGPRFAAVLWSLVVVKFVLPPWLAPPVPAASIAAVVPQAAGDAPTFAGTLFVVWLIGVLVVLAVAACAARRARRWTRVGGVGSAQLHRRVARAAVRAAAAIGAVEPPRTFVSAIVDGACVIGIVRPTIVVPVELATRGGAALDAVLRHECAHVVRRDPWRAFGIGLLRAVWWFHPVVHVGARRLALLREIACDRLAAAADPDGYRRALLSTARPRVLPAGLRFLTRHGALVTRLHALDALGRRHGRVRSGLGLALVLGLACACLPVASSTHRDPFAAPGCLQLRYAVLAELARESAP